MPAASELIAHNRSTSEINEAIGSDWLVYQDLNVLVSACQEGNDSIKRFEDSVFTGDYITGDVDEAYLKQLESKRSDSAKKIAEDDQTRLDLLE